MIIMSRLPLTIPARYGVANGSLAVQMLWVAGFTLLTALAAQIEIPTRPVPFTLQTLAVVVAGALLGPRKGALSMLLYLAMGAIGMPVFSSGGFGLATLFGPTGGYLLSFPAAAALVGLLVSKANRTWTIALVMAAGMALVSLGGVLQLRAVTGLSWEESLAAGVLVFSLWDVVKLAAATAIVKALRQAGKQP
ncbi:MAG: biotin transporter BioY [Desulfuromonadales bacterium]|nr:biotin transporter BioY [Desulfuromonadales bacterium]